MIFQAKHWRYSLHDLLAADLQDVDLYRDGRFVTIYLAPYNYHRVHAPIAGRLRTARYVPGDLFSVNSKTVSYIRNLFARNERLICHIDTAFGSCVLILVGALNVGSISTRWTGEIRPRKSGIVTDCALDEAEVPLTLAKGELLGWFNMGSTVILLLPRDAALLSADLVAASTVRMGHAIGRLTAMGDG
jgi:phosphatidylserine decarboxylase